jgi:hypothetical protein
MVLRKICGVGEYGAEEDMWLEYGAEEDMWCWRIWC